MNIPKTPLKVLDILYKQLALIHTICNDHKIQYWLIGGGLLGQVRGSSLFSMGIGNGPEIIPWDDDLDVGINVEDIEKLRAVLEPEAKKRGYVLWTSIHGLKLKYIKSTAEEDSWKTVGTDIFIYKQVDFYKGHLKPWILASDKSHQAWPHDLFLADEITQIHKVPFGPLTIMIPGNPRRYLFDLYGENCLTHMKLDYNHLENKKHENAGVEVLIDKTLYICS